MTIRERHEPEPWIGLADTLVSGWTDVTATFPQYPVSSYRVHPGDSVELCLHLNPGTITNGTVLFTMPGSYVPASTQNLPVAVDCTATALNGGTPWLQIAGASDANPGQVTCWRLPAGTSYLRCSTARYSLTL